MKVLIPHETKSIFIGDKVEVVCGTIYGSFGGVVNVLSETGIELLSNFRSISEKSMEEIIDHVNIHSPIEVIEHTREGKTSQLVIFIPWIVIEKIKRFD